MSLTVLSVRWGCTPLQEAVRSGRTLLAELIRTKGGTFPDDVGAVQICSAASKGDVPALQLLHLCGVKSDVGDYDFRCPLHLAAAEARLLAVSSLLVISANPNCTGPSLIVQAEVDLNSFYLCRSVGQYANG